MQTIGDEKRTSAAGIAMDAPRQGQLDLGAQGWGVGGTPPPAADGGGGYLSNCTTPEVSTAPHKIFPRDPRLDDLARVGLRSSLLQVAERVGVDAFLEIWRTLDEDGYYSLENDSRLRIFMPRFRQWQRYNRNRYIEELFARGFQADEVADRVRRNLREKITESHVRKLRRRM